MYYEGHFLKRPRLKKFKSYIFVTRKVWCIIWYAQILGAIFFGTFWISTSRDVFILATVACGALVVTEKNHNQYFPDLVGVGMLRTRHDSGRRFLLHHKVIVCLLGYVYFSLDNLNEFFGH